MARRELRIDAAIKAPCSVNTSGSAEEYLSFQR